MRQIDMIDMFINVPCFGFYLIYLIYLITFSVDEKI